tara:strand:- start:2371 stop:3345 length:975 start_codon:yes stop_codon:yes gene_type:complete
MNKITILLVLVLSACSSKKEQRYVSSSNGNLNHVTVVMSDEEWKGVLGETVRTEIATAYEGLPMDEPRFSLKQLHPIAFDGYFRNSRNILWFKKDSLSSFELRQDQFAKPQIVAFFKGEDQEVLSEYVRENAHLVQRLLEENERKEKLRRINKSKTRETTLEKRFNISMSYPSAYKTLKDTTNFIWIRKPVQKGHLNLIIYTLPLKEVSKTPLIEIKKMRDSIGRIYIPGRLKGAYMITEEAYLPYLFKTKLDGKEAYLTKGMWEVKKDFMAGPFVNYKIKDEENDQWVVIEGFAFAPSISKRDYMFELNTILTSFKLTKKNNN